jgi:spore maturation protein B
MVYRRSKRWVEGCLNIFPYLLAMIIAVNIFREAKLLDILNNMVAPIGGLIGLPRR